MRKTIYLAGFTLACMVSGAVQGGERLSGDEITAFFSGKTCNGVHFKLGPGKSFYGEDGTMISHSEDGTKRQGNWTVEGDKRCADLGGKNKCHYVERNDDGSHTLIHGKKGKRLVEFSSCENGNLL